MTITLLLGIREEFPLVLCDAFVHSLELIDGNMELCPAYLTARLIAAQAIASRQDRIC